MEPRIWRSARTFANLSQGRSEWYRIKNQADGPTTVSIYDEIGYFGVTARDFLAELEDVKGDIDLHLNTPGGEVFDGLTIYNALNQRKGLVRVSIDGLAASIGSVIAMAASPGELSIAKHAQLMIHDGFTMAVGNAADMRKLADQLDEQSDNIAGIYSDRTGQPADYWRDQMRQETWYVGKKAVDAGLADRVIEREPVTNNWDLSFFRNAGPEMHGNHVRVDPDNDGDCDACPEGDTDHDYWSPDGTQKRPLPRTGNRSERKFAGKLTHTVVNYREGTPKRNCGTCVMSSVSGSEMHCSLVADPIEADDVCDRYEKKARKNRLKNAVDNSTWDGPAAMSAALHSDNPASAFKAICAGRRDGDPSKESSWALPHHKHPGDPPNAKGVSSALGYLDRTEGLTNKSAAQAHLEAHQKEMGVGAESSDSIDPSLLQAALVSALEGVTKE